MLNTLFLSFMIARLLEKLPQAVFAGNETMAVLQARRLAAAIYFLGPDAIHTFFLESLVSMKILLVLLQLSNMNLVSLFKSYPLCYKFVSYLLLNLEVLRINVYHQRVSPVFVWHGWCPQEACEKFVSIMSQCLSFSSSFSGPINLTSLATSSKSRPLLVMSEIKTNAIDEETVLSKLPIQSEQKHERVEAIVAAEILPRMPPWLSQSAHRVYKTLACIIRLVGEAAVCGESLFISFMVSHLHAL